MMPIEIIALILIIVTAIKLIVIMTNPKKWVGVVESIWKNSGLTTIVCLVGAGVVLYYLLKSGIGIVQILAVMLFLALLMGLSITAYSGDLIGFAKKMLKDKSVIKKAWLAIIIWIVLILWGLKELFVTA